MSTKKVFIAGPHWLKVALNNHFQDKGFLIAVGTVADPAPLCYTDIEIQALLNADFIVAVLIDSFSDYTNHWVEIGIALGRNIPVYLIYEHEMDLKSKYGSYHKIICIQLQPGINMRRAIKTIMDKERDWKKPKTIIGFAGKMGSGKTTASNLLHGYYKMNGTETRILSFANGVRDVVGLITGIPSSELKKTEIKNQKNKNGKTYGQILQEVGTELRKIVGEDVWVDYLQNIMKKTSESIVFIDDVRFPNEVEMIRKNEKGKVIKLIRAVDNPNETRDPNHISETALDDYKIPILPNIFDSHHLFLEYLIAPTHHVVDSKLWSSVD